MADTPEAISKAQKLYLWIGATLFFFTVVTVAVATVPFLDFGAHGFDHVDMTIGLVIAVIKSSLVMLIFMHLNHEKGMVYFLYGMAIFFAAALIILCAVAFWNGTHFGTPDIMDGAEGVDGFYVPAP